MVVLGISLVDGRLAVSRLPNACSMPLSVATTGMWGCVIPVMPCWSCLLAISLDFCGILLVFLLLEPSFSQHTSELSFDAALVSGDQPSWEAVCLVKRPNDKMLPFCAYHPWRLPCILPSTISPVVYSAGDAPR